MIYRYKEYVNALGITDMETIDDFINKIKKSPVYKSGDEYLIKGSIEFAQRWIPIDEEPPKEGEKVILKHENGWTTGRLHTFANGKKSFNCPYPFSEITHWRPIEYK